MMHARMPTAANRLLLAAAITLAAGLLVGCPPIQPPPSTLPFADAGLAPILGTEPVAGGIYTSLSSFAPLSGPALTRALSDRQTILANTRAATKPATQPATAPATEPSEPPPLALKYYLQGRGKFLDGANSEAMDFLDKALALDPNAFTVLRLMGRVCFASNQLARGSTYLQRAYVLHPNDVEVNYLLGRYWLERKDNDRAVSHLLQADDSPERTPSSVQTPLVSFYLARALQADGYHLAASAEYQHFLETITLPVAGYRYDRELNYLIDEAWATNLSTAENLVLVGDYTAALPYYQAAAAQQPTDSFILSRLVNAEIHAHQSDEACDTALDLVASTQGSDDSIKLLAWTYRAAGREKDLLADLRSRTHAASADDPAPTLTLAATQDYLGQKADAFNTLFDYLVKHPANLDVLERLLKRVDSSPTFKRALQATGLALNAVPDKHNDIVRLFLPTTSFVRNVNPDDRSSESFETEYLWGIAWRNQDDFPAAEKYFRQALHLNPAYFPAREALVSVLISQEKFKEASAIVQEVIAKNEGGPKAYQLLVESEATQQRLSNALKVVLDARQKYPENPELRYQLAAIYRLRGQDAQADDELAALIDMAPTFEPAYRSLINSLYARARESSTTGFDADKARADAAALVARLLRAIPNSTFGKINAALLYAREGRLSEAESFLRRLLPDHPDDLDILISLSQIRQALGQPDQAVATLEEPLKAHPTPDLAEALASLYREQNKPEEALALTQRLLNEHPDDEAYTLLQASELTVQKKYADAITLLAAASHKFPRSETVAFTLARLQSTSASPASAVATIQTFIDKNGETAARDYFLSHAQTAAGQDAAAEASLQRVLAIMPDHTGANNDLGYFWTDSGRHLDQAEAMIKIAIDNQPNNAAFLDSLAWLYYKQGRYAEAIPLLEKAISLPGGMEAEVVQHLGDALYRNGRQAEANERWLQARALLDSLSNPLTPDRQKVLDYLNAALAAFKRGDTPTLSPIIAQPAPATAPATLTGQVPTSQNSAPH